MLNLLIAILIALGCNITSDTSQQEIETRYAAEYQQAQEIYNNGNYRTTDGGGVVIIDVVGD